MIAIVIHKAAFDAAFEETRARLQRVSSYQVPEGARSYADELLRAFNYEVCRLKDELEARRG